MLKFLGFWVKSGNPTKTSSQLQKPRVELKDFRIELLKTLDKTRELQYNPGILDKSSVTMVENLVTPDKSLMAPNKTRNSYVI